MYKVKLKKFEGPIELLLELIEKEKLEITELSLAKVADEYLEYLRNNQNIQLANLAEFLLVASKLILIKSRALLPKLKFNEEEEEEIQDLEKQLVEYKKFKMSSVKLGKIVKAGKISYSRESFALVEPTFYSPKNFNFSELKKYFLSVLAEMPKVEKLREEIVTEVVTLEERISNLEQKMRQKISLSFSELISDAKNKADIIVSFLAILEMVKQRVMYVEQKEIFQEIKLKMKNK